MWQKTLKFQLLQPCMKFIADINVTQTVIRNLKENGHDVLDIKKLNPKISDSAIIKLAQEESRIILTHDKDFESLVSFGKYQVGVIMIRLRLQLAKHHWLKLKDLLLNSTEEVLIKSLTKITEDSVTSYPYK